MKIVQAQKFNNKEWEYLTPNLRLQNPLVFIFADRMLLENESFYNDVKNNFPYEHLIFGSTSGEIIGNCVNEDSAVITAIEFEKSKFEIKRANILDFNKDSNKLGEALLKSLSKNELKHVFVISEGSYINGSKLIEGLQKHLDSSVILAGGMCGDNDRFEKTLVSYKDKPREGEVIIIGLYGEKLEVTCASSGGWIPFGPERTITKAEGNILYEIDKLPALDLYSKYLGDKAKELPKASLFYPLNITAEGKTEPVVRTILNIDNTNNSMILAGDVPLNSKVQLMMASVDGLVQGAAEAATIAMKNRKQKPQLALLVSCIGRKLVMDQRVEEEIEEINHIIGEKVNIAGFYSYGEMAPLQDQYVSELHNQTMTLTLISEM
ncbi:FIST N-terminal domain-containing protein [Gramella sp. AN32]|uniref:FIST signal transduction protein n=1 Tax=Christiangramia antarctica TaxID=2058158 RepID=A0ABW5XCA4_9FLAO|nr:FIST N-terminal domain-containing protein [Gramella sp. AN32]MCM4156447.1 histidine kinase [Gramella sp. AN32]